MVSSLDNVGNSGTNLFYTPERRRQLSYVPQTLEELNGFGTGHVEVPKHLCPSAKQSFNVSDAKDAMHMYASVIELATSGVHMGYLNKYVLIRYWRHLALSQPTRRRWEEHFPILR